jgi:hypothetical protein
MVHALGQVAGRTPGSHRLLVPTVWEEQPPVQRAGGLLGDSVDRHPQLAVGGLAQRARVLALHPHRAVAVLGKAGVVHHPRSRRKRPAQQLGQAAADRPPVPRRHRDEVVQRLVVHLAQARRHRLDRLAPALQHQPTQVALPAGALIGTRQRREQIVGEGLQASTDPGQFGCCEAAHSLLPCGGTGRTGPSHPTHQPPT